MSFGNPLSVSVGRDLAPSATAVFDTDGLSVYYGDSVFDGGELLIFDPVAARLIGGALLRLADLADPNGELTDKDRDRLLSVWEKRWEPGPDGCLVMRRSYRKGDER